MFLQIDDYSLVKFLPLDQTDEDSINDILIQIDTCLQYGEDMEPREMRVCRKFFLKAHLKTTFNALLLITEKWCYIREYC